MTHNPRIAVSQLDRAISSMHIAIAAVSAAKARLGDEAGQSRAELNTKSDDLVNDMLTLDSIRRDLLKRLSGEANQ